MIIIIMIIMLLILVDIDFLGKVTREKYENVKKCHFTLKLFYLRSSTYIHRLVSDL